MRLGANLDEYSDRKADMRKSLKNLSEAAPRWLGILRTLAGEPGFDSGPQGGHREPARISPTRPSACSPSRPTTFNQHKEEQGQERAEPK